MAKSIRSKIKRKNRAEFRATIGADAAKKNMDAIQEKLRQVVQQGSIMSSTQKVSSMLDISDDRSDDEISVDEEMAESQNTVNSPKSEISQKTCKKKKHWIQNVAGQSGARLARKVISRAKSHGKWKNGSFVTKSKPRPPRTIRKNK
eukprot:CAMPEP_0172423334 /NCGR_PEP_ID=MMETSP1064-20121228/15346_1 /TAXON_ID=202472 /ORGANISM="Aulacoseira subarctica , Strain CCAP 1002/5" /LENGTH=146 /DNA_ID=CAMNT_0013164655 /DNA_START=52 /DNA_END=489 /DNA_ORIENTATION=+